MGHRVCIYVRAAVHRRSVHRSDYGVRVLDERQLYPLQLRPQLQATERRRRPWQVTWWWRHRTTLYGGRPTWVSNYFQLLSSFTDRFIIYCIGGPGRAIVPLCVSVCPDHYNFWTTPFDLDIWRVGVNLDHIYVTSRSRSHRSKFDVTGWKCSIFCYGCRWLIEKRRWSCENWFLGLHRGWKADLNWKM